MTARIIRAAIERAVEIKDEPVLDAIAHRMCDASEAKQIMLAKGYGTSGMSLAALARLVPLNTATGE